MARRVLKERKVNQLLILVSLCGFLIVGMLACEARYTVDYSRIKFIKWYKIL